MTDILNFILLESEDDFDLFGAIESLSDAEKAKLAGACESMLKMYSTEGDEKFVRFNVIMVQSLLV